MQYLLDQGEMDTFEQHVKENKKLPTVDKLQEFCTFVADNLILKDGWYKDKVWGCILTKKHEWYCDDCPAKRVCPNEYKNWSK